MKLSQLESLLETHRDKQFRLILPGQTLVPVSFHITEVGHVTKKFMDCGGKVHTVQTCQLQAWLSDDTDHRIASGKMVDVLHRAGAAVLPHGEDLDIEVEYEDAVISQYPVADYTVSDDAVTLNLMSKHTDCLAKESCCPPLKTLTMAAKSGCGCGPSGC